MICFLKYFPVKVCNSIYLRIWVEILDYLEFEVDFSVENEGKCLWILSFYRLKMDFKYNAHRPSNLRSEKNLQHYQVCRVIMCNNFNIK